MIDCITEMGKNRNTKLQESHKMTNPKFYEEPCVYSWVDLCDESEELKHNQKTRKK